MSHKCARCIFEGEYYGVVKTCDRYPEIDRSINEYNKPGPCKYHITHREIIRLQNAGMLKGENNV